MFPSFSLHEKKKPGDFVRKKKYGKPNVVKSSLFRSGPPTHLALMFAACLTCPRHWLTCTPWERSSSRGERGEAWERIRRRRLTARRPHLKEEEKELLEEDLQEDWFSSRSFWLTHPSMTLPLSTVFYIDFFSVKGRTDKNGLNFADIEGPEGKLSPPFFQAFFIFFFSPHWE